jgi:7-cyano-7-deazaguanine synthase
MTTVLIYSGGSDSFTLLHQLHHQNIDLRVLSFDYGQRHRKELDYARRNTAKLGLSHKIVTIDFMRDIADNSVLTSNKDVPEGFYENSNMAQTVVPNRNMIMLSIAAAYAVNIRAGSIAYGAHAGDHTIYPDCRPQFVEAMQTVLGIANYYPLNLWVPLLYWDKRRIYRWGLGNNLDYRDTWTCYNGREKACGRCGSCVERLHAFHDIKHTDPLEYEDREYFLSVIPQDKKQ